MGTHNDKAQIVYLPVKSIYPHPQNPRKDLGDLTDLVGSIKAKGILQNLTVVPRVIADVTITDEWVAVIGHRRHAAAIQAGLTEVPCVISNMTPKEQFETMMIENVQRNALTAYEQAKGFQMMLDMGDSVEEVARKTGFSESTIRRPQEALLYAAYAKLDGKNQGYYETKYEYKLSISMPSRSKNERLNLLYKGLVSLGYEMSEEEIQLQNGSHPLFDRAKAFKKTYDQDLAKLKRKLARES